MIKDIMIFCAASLACTVFSLFICLYRGAAQVGKIRLCKETLPEGFVPLQGARLILILALCFAIGVGLLFSLKKNTDTLGLIKLFGLYCIVAAAAIVDGKRKIIPNLVIVIGLIFRLGLGVYEYFKTDNFTEILKSDLIGFVLGFIFLCVVSLLSHGSIGMGDAKLFGVIGITGGAFCTYSTLLASLLISVVVSLILIAAKKIGKKDSLPFGPFVAVGYIISVLLTSY